MNDPSRIASVFAEHFTRWNLVLPKTAVKRRKAGAIKKQGWLIQYCFGRDERGEFLDYYAAHRMTSDSHVRIRHDGTVEDLPAMSEFMFFDEGDDIEKVKEKYYAENRAIARLLFEKGFHCFSPNMALHAGLVDTTEPEEAESGPERKA